MSKAMKTFVIIWMLSTTVMLGVMTYKVNSAISWSHVSISGDTWVRGTVTVETAFDKPIQVRTR